MVIKGPAPIEELMVDQASRTGNNKTSRWFYAYAKTNDKKITLDLDSTNELNRVSIEKLITIWIKWDTKKLWMVIWIIF